MPAFLYAYNRQLCINHLKRWEQKGRITELDIEDLFNNASSQWRRIFRLNYRRKNTIGLNSNEKINLALDCLDETMKIILNFKEVPLDNRMTSGCFYELSNRPNLGWLKDWEEKYKR